MGLGRFGGGVGAARWLAAEGARVTVTDLAEAETLAGSLRQLDGEKSIAFHLGGHREEDFRGVDLVVVNPAVRPGNPFVAIARDSGARITSEIELVIRHCPATLVGVTGSNGKSTTAAMIDAVLRADGRTSWLGGNLGGSLLDRLEWIQPGDCAVLELSSFQLWRLGPGTPMPHVAVVTGFTPNHLDWHADYDEYAAAKRRMLLEQTPDDVAVLNTLDDEVASWQPLVRGRQAALPPLEDIPELAVPGGHNRINAACAAAAAGAIGCRPDAIRRGLETFGGLPQRLEPCAVVAGRRFYNDSSSTTPESTIAALGALEGPIWLMAGGKDKGFDYGDLAAAVAERAAGAALFGSVRELLRGWVGACGPRLPCTATETMAESLQWCWRRARPGDAIVLSPGCASTDQFDNYEGRGREFVRLVRALAEAAHPIDKSPDDDIEE